MNDIHKFRLSKYPLFTLLISYHWIEVINPFISHAFQILPKINNAHIAIILAWIFLPIQLKNISLPKSKIAIILPFLIIISIKVPYVEVRQMNTLITVASEWIYFLFYYPLYIKLLSTRSGRENFFLSASISTIIACTIYLISLGGIRLFEFISSNILSQLMCFSVPIAARGVIFKSGSVKYINILALLLIIFSVIFSGGRSMLLVSIVQISFFSIYFLSFQKVIKQASLFFLLLFSFSFFINVDESQIDFRNKKYNRIINWKDDGSIWLRIALYSKANDIFLNNFLLGAGWGPRTLSGHYGEEIEFTNFRSVNTGTKGLHSTALRIISGTGLLGIISFLFFFIKNLRYLYQLKFRFLKKNPDFFIFLSIAIGLIMNALQNTTGLFPFMILSSFILSAHIYVERLIRNYKVYLFRNNIKH